MLDRGDQATDRGGDAVRRIVIVGGGTAGWLVAGVLGSRYPRRGEQGVAITLIESRQQPPIGVGEGTWPTIRSTLKQIGVSETDFLRECDASFKQGSQFASVALWPFGLVTFTLHTRLRGGPPEGTQKGEGGPARTYQSRHQAIRWV